MVSEWAHSVVLTLPKPSRDASTRNSLPGCVAHHQFLGQTDGDEAHRHERRVAPAMTCCSRHSDVTGFCWLPMPTMCERLQFGDAPAKTSKFFLTSPVFLLRFASRETVSRLMPGSQLLGQLSRLLQRSDDWQLSLRVHVCVTCTSRDPKHVLDTTVCFLHTSTCVCTLKHVSRILVSDSARHSAKRDPDLLW